MYFLEKLTHLKVLKLWYYGFELPVERYKPMIEVFYYCGKRIRANFLFFFCKLKQSTHIKTQSNFVIFAHQSDKSKSVKITFDCDINVNKCSIQIIDNSYYCLVLPIKQGSFSWITLLFLFFLKKKKKKYMYSDENDDWPTSDELIVSKNQVIECRFCGNVISDNRRKSQEEKGDTHVIEKIYPLPSEYWLELSDLWFCCAQHQIEFSPTAIHAKANCLLTGQLHMIFHPNNILAQSVVVRPAQQQSHTTHSISTWSDTLIHASHKDERDVFDCLCSRCGVTLGQY
ncbi:hypothetical protein RFI_07907, partial [Reticulomyxa filosa]